MLNYFLNYTTSVINIKEIATVGKQIENCVALGFFLFTFYILPLSIRNIVLSADRHHSIAHFTQFSLKFAQTNSELVMEMIQRTNVISG